MLLITVALLIVLALAGLVTAYVAFPHRGESIPHAEWLSNAMVRSDQAISARLTLLEEHVGEHREARHRS